MVRRFRLIDGEFRRLAPLYPNTVVIDRDSKEFHERQGLVDIITLAGLPMFRRSGSLTNERPVGVPRHLHVALQLAPRAMAESIPCVRATFESADGNSGRAGTQSVSIHQPVPQLDAEPERPRGPSPVRPQGVRAIARKGSRRSHRSAKASTRTPSASANTSNRRSHPSAQGLAIFASSGSEFFEAIPARGAVRRSLAVHRLGAAPLPARAGWSKTIRAMPR